MATNKTITILGIDPGSRITGYGVIWIKGSQQGHIAHGCIKTTGDDFASRLFQIHQQLIEVIQTYQPDEGAIEQIFMHRNPQAAFKLGQARGAALVAMAQFSLLIGEYSPRQVKKATVGYGAANKEQMQHMVQSILRLEKKPPADAADALGIAMCHASMRSLAAKLAAYV